MTATVNSGRGAGLWMNAFTPRPASLRVILQGMGVNVVSARSMRCNAEAAGSCVVYERGWAGGVSGFYAGTT